VPAVIYILFVIYIVVANLGKSSPEQIFLPAALLLFGVVLFVPIIILDFVILSVYLIKSRHRTVASGERTVVMIVWSLIMVGILAYLVYNLRYYREHRPSSDKVISMIQQCQVSSIQQLDDGEAEVSVKGADPSRGAVITRGNWDIFVNAVRSSKQKCGEVEYFNKLTIRKWLSLDEALIAIKDCRVTLVTSYVYDLNYDPFSNENEVERPKGYKTGILLEDFGSLVSLEAVYELKPQIEPTIEQYKNSCHIVSNL
jgi:hypothetical protein